MFKTELYGPAATAGEAAEGTMLTVRKCSVVFIYIRDDRVNQAIPKACAGRRVPIMIIGEDNDKRNRLPGRNKFLCQGGQGSSYAWILIVRQPMQNIENREMGIC